MQYPTYLLITIDFVNIVNYDWVELVPGIGNSDVTCRVNSFTLHDSKINFKFKLEIQIDQNLTFDTLILKLPYRSSWAPSNKKIGM